MGLVLHPYTLRCGRVNLYSRDFLVLGVEPRLCPKIGRTNLGVRCLHVGASGSGCPAGCGARRLPPTPDVSVHPRTRATGLTRGRGIGGRDLEEARGLPPRQARGTWAADRVVRETARPVGAGGGSHREVLRA